MVNGPSMSQSYFGPSWFPKAKAQPPQRRWATAARHHGGTWHLGSSARNSMNRIRSTRAWSSHISIWTCKSCIICAKYTYIIHTHIYIYVYMYIYIYCFIEGSLDRSQTSDNMDRWKAEMARVREQNWAEKSRREKSRREKIREEKESEERRRRCAKR